MTIVRFLLLVLVATVAALAPSRPAEAHATFVRGEPADGGTVATAPAVARLIFNEPVSPLVLRLTGPDGAVRELSGARLEGDTLVVPLPAAATDGTYVLSYRLVSQDGHPVAGSLVFAIGDAPPAAGAAALRESSDAMLVGAIWSVRAALTGGILFGIGGALFLAFASVSAPGTARRAAGWPLALATIAAPAAIGLQGLDALGLPFSGLTDPAAWSAGLHSPYAATVAGVFLGALLAAVSLRLRSIAAQRLTALLGLAALAFAVSLSGHASTAPPQAITHRAVSVHVGAAAVWIGALVPLALLLAAGGEAATRALARFSQVIPYTVAALALTGLFLAAVQVETPAALWTTAYGRVLLAKLALVAAMLALAAMNRWRLTKPVLAGDATARRRLVQVIAVEAMLALAVVGVVSLWRFTPPPRSIAAAAAAPTEVHLHGETAMATVTVAPGRAGPVAVEIALATGDFGLLAAKEVDVAFSNPAAGIEPIRRSAAESDGVWRVDGLTLPVAGSWSVRVDVLVGDFDKVTLEGAVDLR